MMILFVKLTKGIGHKFYQLMKSSPIVNNQETRVLNVEDGLLTTKPCRLFAYNKNDNYRILKRKTYEIIRFWNKTRQGVVSV